MESGLVLPQTEFNHINPKLDREHTAIFKAIDNLYAVCEKHWETEELLFQKGLDEMPKKHKGVIRQINRHRKQHLSVLEEIIEMKKNLMSHIDNDDTHHFHWDTR